MNELPVPFFSSQKVSISSIKQICSDSSEKNRIVLVFILHMEL